METRKDARLAREVRVALPKELTHEQRLDLTRSFIKEHFVCMGMIADFALHDPQPHKGDNEDNFHAHILLTTRKANATGLHHIVTRDWNLKSTLDHWREQWAIVQNRFLKQYGHKARVDHRTLAEQRRDAIIRGDDNAARSLDRIPEIHVGKKGRHSTSANAHSQDRIVKTSAGRERKRFYTVTDNGSRKQFNQSILKHNRDIATAYARTLQAEKARLMQKRFDQTGFETSTQRGTMYQWELSKNLYGDLPAHERPTSYWKALAAVIDMVPLKDRDNPYDVFHVPQFDDLPFMQKLERGPLPAGVVPFDKDGLSDAI